MTARPKLYLINGPLGAGKTTFLRQLLKQSAFANARVIENEFASTSIDTATLHEHTAQVQTIAGVCICCGTGEELIEALDALGTSNEPVIIEATGVANSLKLIEKMVVADVFERYELAHGVFVLDAAEADEEMIALYADELRSADTVLLSKTDLIDKKQQDRLERLLEQQQITDVHGVENGDCDFSLLNQPSDMLVIFGEFEGEIRLHDDKMNYTVVSLDGHNLSPDRLESAWPALRDTYGLKRMKGNIVSSDGHSWHIEATPAQFRVYESKAESQLVLIGEKAREVTLANLLEACDE